MVLIAVSFEDFLKEMPKSINIGQTVSGINWQVLFNALCKVPLCLQLNDSK